MDTTWAEALYKNLGICAEGQLLESNDFLVEQIKILLKILERNKVYMRLNDEDRRTLAETGAKLNPKNREKYSKVVTAETILAWHRRLVGKLLETPTGERKGKTSVTDEERQLIIEMARKNPNWGLVRISGEMLKLKFKRCPTTIKNVLLKAGIEPPPYKCRSTGTWDRFMKVHKEVWQTDFAVYPLLDLSSYSVTSHYIQVFINTHSREVILGGITPAPNDEWMQQSARNISTYEMEGADLLIRDNDKVYQPSFDDIFQDNGTKVKTTSIGAPDMNAYIERFIRSMKEECLSNLVLYKESQLRNAVKKYISFYNTKRPHQGLDNQIPKSTLDNSAKGNITCIESLGGLLNSYERQAI